VDIAAVNPWMLRMAGDVADGVHVHPLGEPRYLARHVMPNVAAGAAKSGRSPSDIAVIVPVMTIVGDSDEERHNERELVTPRSRCLLLREPEDDRIVSLGITFDCGHACRRQVLAPAVRWIQME
jgi:alkanesulfonate monooxygenase SsuD/methylene tetrahydromethanopterin reductase-like flavin-dependent oxidoreductase (luciferase family)